jgi:hypothetical protein
MIRRSFMDDYLEELLEQQAEDLEEEWLDDCTDL